METINEIKEKEAKDALSSLRSSAKDIQGEVYQPGRIHQSSMQDSAVSVNETKVKKKER